MTKSQRAWDWAEPDPLTAPYQTAPEHSDGWSIDAAPAEPAEDRRVVLPTTAEHRAMDLLQDDLADLAQRYPLAASAEWQDIQRKFGHIAIFAIESAPITFDVFDEDMSFSGSARVLAEVYEPQGKKLIESLVLDATVRGSLADSTPRIESFHFPDLEKAAQAA